MTGEERRRLRDTAILLDHAALAQLIDRRQQARAGQSNWWFICDRFELQVAALQGHIDDGAINRP